MSDKPAPTITLPEQLDFSDGFGPATLAFGEQANMSDALLAELSPVFAEQIEARDALALNPLTLIEQVEFSDFYGPHTLKFPETVNLSDQLGSETITLPESVNMSDRLFAQVTNMECSGDNWTDALDPNTNHGTDATLLVKEDTDAVNNNKRRGWIKWRTVDLGDFEPNTGVPGLNFIRLQIASSDALAAQTLTVRLQRSAADPFDEAAQTWNNQADGTVMQTETKSIAAGGGFAEYLFGAALTSTDWNNFLGQWLVARLDNDGGAINLTTFTIKSQEDATAANRPKINLNIRRDP
jgi:hypothetical protein